MNEGEINKIISKSMNILGYKIPDSNGGNGSFSKFSPTPFDGFGLHKIEDKVYNVYWESKFSKGLKAFNVKRIEQHQADNLDKCQESDNSLCIVPFGVHAGKGDLRVYLFMWNALREMFFDIDHTVYDNTKYYIPCLPKSIPKAKLDTLPYEKVKDGKIEFKTFIDKI